MSGVRSRSTTRAPTRRTSCPRRRPRPDLATEPHMTKSSGTILAGDSRPEGRSAGTKLRNMTQGTFSFLPDLTDEQIRSQVEYCLGNGWAVAIEYTDDPHPRNSYWEMFGVPMFDIRDAAGVLTE